MFVRRKLGHSKRAGHEADSVHSCEQYPSFVFPSTLQPCPLGHCSSREHVTKSEALVSMPLSEPQPSHTAPRTSTGTHYDIDRRLDSGMVMALDGSMFRAHPYSSVFAMDRRLRHVAMDFRSDRVERLATRQTIRDGDVVRAGSGWSRDPRCRVGRGR